jgi:hypothetical protein
MLKHILVRQLQAHLELLLFNNQAVPSVAE